MPWSILHYSCSWILLPNSVTDKRIASLDILRGLALLGMFVVHFHERSTDPGGIDELVRTLSGAWSNPSRTAPSRCSLAPALPFSSGGPSSRASRSSGSTSRRLAVLALLRIRRARLLGFNVLLGYAVWGVPLLADPEVVHSSAAAERAALCGIRGALSPCGASCTCGEGAGRRCRGTISGARRSAADVNGAVEAAEAQDELQRPARGAAPAHAWFYTQPFFFMPGATLALFIVGLLLVRHRVFEAPLAHTRLLGGMAAFGVVSWLAANWLLDVEPRSADAHLSRSVADVRLRGCGAAAAGAPACADGRLRSIGNAGRMALTNYLLQIAALDLLFSGYALGLGQIRPVVGLRRPGCFAVECAFSSAWLARFRLGPAEWLWRSLTYGRMQPMRADASRFFLTELP